MTTTISCAEKQAFAEKKQRCKGVIEALKTAKVYDAFLDSFAAVDPDKMRLLIAYATGESMGNRDLLDVFGYLSAEMDKAEAKQYRYKSPL